MKYLTTEHLVVTLSSSPAGAPWPPAAGGCHCASTGDVVSVDLVVSAMPKDLCLAADCGRNVPGSLGTRCFSSCVDIAAHVDKWTRCRLHRPARHLVKREVLYLLWYFSACSPRGNITVGLCIPVCVACVGVTVIVK